MEAVSLLYGVVRKFEIAFITLFAGFLISRIIGKIVKRMLAETELNRVFAVRGASSASEIIGSTVEGVLYLVTVIVVFKQLGLGKFVLYLTAILFIILIISLVFLAVKQLQNVFAWFVLRSFLNRNLGKKVQIGDLDGKLESVNLIESCIIGSETFFVPHAYSLTHIKKIRED